MSNTALIQARIEPELKNDVDAILNDNGLDIPTAIRMFFAKIRQVGGIPFDVKSYNAETIAAMDEANRIAHDPSVKSHASFAELVAELDSDDE
ncbi:MAG: type II toxin-antitoxin system RelB/DinJ family antitoxin [Clostridiales Family XIII bacterium]|jgi:DNA-damage-inducible protein J|nr:type II toxin-antitoxin system RelB/DinJ family antitoxin [Clostridiales Family XIII bacterium]